MGSLSRAMLTSYKILRFPKLNVPLIYCKLLSSVGHPMRVVAQGTNENANTLTVVTLMSNKSLVSDPGVSCLLPAS